MNVPELIDNTDKKQFEMHLEGKVLRIEYIKTLENIYLTHTEVPSGLEGKGYGSTLVKAVLEEVKRLDLILIPLCPFVALYIKRHPEYKALVLKGINIA